MDIKCDSTLRRREEDQHRQFFRDVVKAVLDFRGNEQQASCGNLQVFLLSLEARSSPEHVIHLIFMMRMLRVGSSSLQHIQARAHGGDSHEFAVQLAVLVHLLVNPRKVSEYGVHARIPPNTRSVNWGTRLFACKSPSGLYHW